MIVPDLNLLLYAYNPFVPKHAEALAWWQSAVDATELIGLPHEILFGFVRIATNPNLGSATVSLDAARTTVRQWLNLPQARVLTPGPDHFKEVMELMRESNSTGRILSDAVLANYAIQNRATLFTTDSDFARFRGLQWNNPLHE